MFKRKWKPSKTAAREFAQTMDEITAKAEISREG